MCWPFADSMPSACSAFGCRDLQAQDDAWLRGVEEAAVARGYGEDVVFLLGRLLSLDPTSGGQLLSCSNSSWTSTKLNVESDRLLENISNAM